MKCIRFFQVFLSLFVVAICPILAVADDLPISSKFVCRIEDGAQAKLMNVKQNKAANFAKILKSYSSRIKTLQSDVRRLINQRASKSKIKKVKNKLDGVKTERKYITQCRRGTFTGANQPPPGSGPGMTYYGQVMVAPFEYTARYKAEHRCNLYAFIRMPDIEGVIWKDMLFDRLTNGEWRAIRYPVYGNYEDDVFDIIDDSSVYLAEYYTVGTLRVEAGWHWFNAEFDSWIADDCASERASREIEMINKLRNIRITSLKRGERLPD